MNIVKAGESYKVYSDAIETYHKLPAKIYSVGFDKMSGFFLIEHLDINVNEEKIYGNINEKVDKTLRSFNCSDRNFGVILSGQKGCGKTLFSKVLIKEALQLNLPVILIDEAIPGIDNFLSSIDQEAVILFDEFEKVFEDTDDWNPQDDLLTLFDGTDSGKKLFIITCNDLKKLNIYFLNRPGRFHYHFELGTPSINEVEEYMKDKLKPEYYDQINKIAEFMAAGDLTYDCLRAIAFELNNGYSLDETMRDLNISRHKYLYFTLIIYTKDGDLCTFTNCNVNVLDDTPAMFTSDYRNTLDTYVSFPGTAITYDCSISRFILDKSKVSLTLDPNDPDQKDTPLEIKSIELKLINKETENLNFCRYE